MYKRQVLTLLIQGPDLLLEQMLSGGLLLGAIFMATDYVTRPVTKKGLYIYGVILGFLTAIFRIFGASAEGVSYACLLYTSSCV